MRTSVSAIRLAIAALIAVAVVATFAETAGRTAVNPFNFFGYFTLQSNIFFGAVLGWTAIVALARVPAPPYLVYARAAVTVYIVMVGLVYAVLLAPLAEAGGVPVPWANTALHIITPVYAIVDWVLVGDRPRLAQRWFWTILVYPVVWVAVVLARGASDGWVPYPFLAPSNGYDVVALYCLVIFAIALLLGLGVYAVSRLKVLRPAR